jgi:hypothetical protein
MIVFPLIRSVGLKVVQSAVKKARSGGKGSTAMKPFLDVSTLSGKGPKPSINT